MSDESEYMTLKEFLDLAGFSRQRLYILWKEDRGPPRVKRPYGKYQRVYIPRGGAMVWLHHHRPQLPHPQWQKGGGTAMAIRKNIRKGKGGSRLDKAHAANPLGY